ncbi:pre-mRNA-processing factor 39-like isoform X1 [Polyodon spathula]|uniref:pre-mRNA-processing factor 39-like isoform X1 n=1 Tax=Polyodon spathula TaxID=7913 RepID=UPI001B7F12C3|nr:pre-mRNA-processing factor 39-like isoform X1 [Polyodon spathula]
METAGQALGGEIAAPMTAIPDSDNSDDCEPLEAVTMVHPDNPENCEITALQEEVEESAPEKSPDSPANMALEGSPIEVSEEADASPDASRDATAVISEAEDFDVPFPAEYEKFWKVVEENPQDFTGWTYLLQYVEQENHLVASRKAFDAFFSRYPYCYGYWKKYADLEKRHGNIKRAEEAYRQGLQAIPLSVDLWIHYINFLKESLDPSEPETESQLRSAYEHAVLAAGTDFRSDRLWEAYINWETELGNLREVTAIYDRLLGIPTQLYSHHFQRFREHIQNNLPKQFLSVDEFIKLRRELASVNGHGGEDAPPGDDVPPGIEDLADPAKLITEIENMRHRVIESRQEVFNHNEHEVSKRWTFEEGIKRPYFHVKPLEKAQLNNWKEYLDFEIENGTPERVAVLFERCLVACALYEEFWVKYAKYLENHSIDGVRHVYMKACTIHLPKKPMVHLLWSAFEEQQGNIEEARGILKTFEETVPGLAMVRLRRVSLERRHGNLEEAESLLREAIKNGKTASVSSFYSIKLARLLFKVQKSLQRAREVLLEAIERDEVKSILAHLAAGNQSSPKLYLNLLEIEFSGDLKLNEEHILSCFDKAVNSSLPVETRISFSQRKVEFLEDFGFDVTRLMTAYDEHQSLLKKQDSLKRKAENGAQEPEEKKQRAEDTTVETGQMMGGDMQANQSAYNYSSWYQYNYQNPWGYGQYYPPPPT